MASWKEERDRLVAQTLAFVQQVAAAHPSAAAMRPSDTVTSETAPPTRSMEGVVHSSVPAAEDLDGSYMHLQDRAASEIGAPAVTAVPAHILTATLLPNHARHSSMSARVDITQRVAAFKARQHQIGREREAYYDTVQARIRTSLAHDARNDSGGDRL